MFSVNFEFSAVKESFPCLFRHSSKKDIRNLEISPNDNQLFICLHVEWIVSI